MARPKRGNYATGEAGLARYKEALRKYLAKTKKTTKPEVKKPEAKKPVAKKPVAKKPATKKPVTKKPVTKKPVTKKPVAKKPVTKKPVTKKPVAKKTGNNLKIKKATNTAVKTTKQVIKKATPVVKQAAKTVAKKAGEVKQTVGKKVDALKKVKQTKAPRPTTPQQKFVSKAAKNIKKYGGKVKDKLGKDLVGKKGILKIRNIGSGIRGGVAGLATAGLTSAINTRVDRAFAKRKGMTLQEFNAAKEKMKDNRNIVRSVKNIVKKVRGNSGESSTTKNINKQKKANTTPNRGLKIKKTERSSRKNTNKDYNAPTATKTADKRFSTFRVNADENLKLQKERQKGNTETYSRKLSPQAKKTKTTPTKSKPKKMHAIEKRNRERFGDAHVDRLKAKHAEWKKRRKKK